MPNIRFHFEGAPEKLTCIGKSFGLTPAHPMKPSLIPFSLTFEGDARDLKTALTDTGFFTHPMATYIGSPLMEVKGSPLAPSEIKADEPAQDQEGSVTDATPEHTGPHSPEDVKQALKAAAQEDADDKKAKAAAKRQERAAAKREADAQSRIAATVSEAQASEESDPNGATLAALLTQDTEAAIPETVTSEAELTTPEDDGLADLLGDTSGGDEDPKADLRAELAKLPDADLTKRIRDVLGVKGAPWFKALLGNIGKANLAKMTREEIIEVLVQEG